MRIKDSELILIKNRIYHLGLAVEELANTVITVGDPNRVSRVSKYFDTLVHKIQKREFITHSGYIGDKYISVIGTGIGPDNIDILLNEIDAVKNIDFNTREIKVEKQKLNIIRMGTSGALQKEIPVDSIIASSHGFGLDGLLNFYDYKKSSFQTTFLNSLKIDVPTLFDICKPTIFPGSETLLNELASDLYKGVTLTAGGFYAPQGRELRLKQRMKKLIDQMVNLNIEGLKFANFEMETSSIYGLSHLLGHRAISINAIIANRATGEFSKDPYQTVDKMIAQTLAKIIELKEV